MIKGNNYSFRVKGVNHGLLIHGRFIELVMSRARGPVFLFLVDGEILEVLSDGLYEVKAL